MRLTIGFILALACYGQGADNRTLTGTRNDSTLNWTPPNGTYSARPGSPTIGQVYIVTDTLCDGTSTGPATCRWSGSTWVSIGGGGGGTPGGSSGQMQINSSGSFAGQGTVFGSGMTTTLKQTSIECTSGTISLSGSTWTYPGGTVAAAAATSQEFAITGTMTGNTRFNSALISEHVQFASGSLTVVKASIGRPGSTTNDEMVPQFNLMNSSGDSWYTMDRPQPPVLGVSNTYSLVVALRATGGNISALTSGAAVNFEVCGYVAQ